MLQSRTSEGTEAQSMVGKHEKAHESQKMGKQDIKRGTRISHGAWPRREGLLYSQRLQSPAWLTGSPSPRGPLSIGINPGAKDLNL